MRTLIINEEPAVHNILKLFLSTCKDVVLLGECSSLAEAKVMIKNTQPDLLFLSINIGDKTGFELLEEFPDSAFKIIFIIDNEQDVLKIQETEALEYLLKPISQAKFTLAIEKARLQPANLVKHPTSTKDFENRLLKITFRSRTGLHIIPLNELLYCEADGGYTTFYLKDGSKLVSSKPLKEYATILPGELFIRIHQSYIINIDYVVLFSNRNTVILKTAKNGSGKEIPVSIRRKEELLKILESY
ncbi:two component transcriptional regulator, LytTR family [Pseudarcicella hirudinis]|uniref:Two component transcriptional regulator, LytTR family n=1 Tax=Pseudarcicella hirudinis TaxID=1079859 RepID=A0A1I5VEG6_9BACT|nr:LytTR family DNA-binding domain-containing protein [Pseudarcicella hirudinis]SFQ05376.1 two component transcriptional regulator, LytTR family [Pseudarcicella hirudinis]